MNGDNEGLPDLAPVPHLRRLDRFYLARLPLLTVSILVDPVDVNNSQREKTCWRYWTMAFKAMVEWRMVCSLVLE